MIRNWLSRRNAGQTRSTDTRKSRRLRVECLEDRSVPSTFTVNTTLDDVTPANGKFSLREAITKANTTPGADVIVLPAGVFKITIPGAGEDANATGDFDITDNLTIQGAGAGLTIIDGQQLDRVFDVFGTGPSSIKVVVEKLTVRNGDATGHGGGVQVVDADLVVRDSAVTGNRASQTGGGVSNGSSAGTGDVTVVRTTVGRNVAGTNGGGLGVFGSSLLTVKDSTVRRNVATDIGGGIATNTATLTNCTLNGNTTATNGGGIFAGTVTLTNCTVNGNSAATNGGGISATTVALTNCTVSGNLASIFSGGGIFATTTTLTNSTVSGNSAGFNGGGILAGTTTLTNSTVSDNSAGGNGGGIFANNTATLTGSSVSGNTADSGGGIWAGTATLTNSTASGNTAGSSGGGIEATVTATLTNSTVSGNSSGGNGGGMWANAATLLNCTIVENIAQFGGGLMSSPGGTISVRNTIVAQNLVGFGGTGPEVVGNFASGGHNLIGAGGSGFTNGANGDIVGTAVNPIDPKLGPLQNNGGKTKTHALLAGSPAIDRGDNAGVPATDQRGPGFPRKKDGNGDGLAFADIGAFER